MIFTVPREWKDGISCNDSPKLPVITDCKRKIFSFIVGGKKTWVTKYVQRVCKVPMWRCVPHKYFLYVFQVELEAGYQAQVKLLLPPVHRERAEMEFPFVLYM